MRELGRNHTRVHDAPQRQTRRTARAFTATTLVVLAASLLATVPAQAAPGDLDASFSGDGKQTTDFGDWDHGPAVAIQADGKIVVAGGSGANFALARYNADGSLDTAFSGDGKADDRLRRPRSMRGRRDPGRRQDRGRRRLRHGLRARPLQRRRLARPRIRRAASVTTDLGGSDYAHVAGDPGRRQDRRRRELRRGLRARPLQRRRLARHFVRGRWQA